MAISNAAKEPEVVAQLHSTHNTNPAKDHDEFIKLPAEIQVLVMMLVPDLPALQHLISASPILKAIFDQNHIKIANAILSRLTLELRQMMRAVAVALTEGTDAPLIDGEVFHNMGSSNSVTWTRSSTYPHFLLPCHSRRLASYSWCRAV